MFFHRQGWKQAPALRNVADSGVGDLKGRHSNQILVFPFDPTAARRRQAHDRTQQGGLTHSVSAQQRDTFLAHIERAALQNVTVSDICLQVVDL